MKTAARSGTASAQTAQAAQPVARTAEARPAHGAGQGFAGGLYRDKAYRHAPRSRAPARNANAGPKPRAARPRPATVGQNNAEDEHAFNPGDHAAGGQGRWDAWSGTEAGMGSGHASGTPAPQSPNAIETSPSLRCRLPPPPPPVVAGAALRRSRLPAAALLAAPPAPGGLPVAALFNAMASMYFQSAPASSATRLDTLRAARRHLAQDTPPVTLATVKSLAIDWGQQNRPTDGRAPGSPQACLLFPLFALTALRELSSERQGLAALRHDMVQRGAAFAPKETNR